jgi:hypothetical protein
MPVVDISVELTKEKKIDVFLISIVIIIFIYVNDMILNGTQKLKMTNKSRNLISDHD